MITTRMVVCGGGGVSGGGRGFASERVCWVRGERVEGGGGGGDY